MTLITTRAGSKRQFIQDFTLTTSTGIVEKKFQKRACPRSKKHNNRRAVRQRTAEGANNYVNSRDRNAPLRAVKKKQLITVEHYAL